LKKKSEILGQQGFYKEAKKLKTKIKRQQSNEREKHDYQSKEKYLNKS